MDSKLKILGLHGYRQNSTKFRSQTGALRKLLKKHVDFYFITAPHKVPDSEKLSDDDECSWWFTKETSFSSRDVSDQNFGFDESLTLIEDTFKAEGPFDGVLGFSQGAALASLLCALKHLGKLSYSFDFVILISAFKSLCKPHLEFFDGLKINVPSLHVIGDTDRIILKETSNTLTHNFIDPVIVRHEGGHFVAATGPYKQGYVDFIVQQKQRFLSSSNVH